MTTLTLVGPDYVACRHCGADLIPIRVPAFDGWIHRCEPEEDDYECEWPCPVTWTRECGFPEWWWTSDGPETPAPFWPLTPTPTTAEQLALFVTGQDTPPRLRLIVLEDQR